MIKEPFTDHTLRRCLFLGRKVVNWRGEPGMLHPFWWKIASHYYVKLKVFEYDEPQVTDAL